MSTSAEDPHPDQTLPGDLELPVLPGDEDPIAVQLPVIPEEETETEEEAEATDPSGEGEPPAGAGEPVEVEDSAIVLAAIAAAAAVSVLRMQAKGRKDVSTTFAAEALSKIKDPDQVLADLRASAEARVAAQREKGANDAYLAKQLVGRVAGVRGTSVG